MNDPSVGQMTWRPEGALSVGVLHLRLSPFEPWRPYTEFPEYAMPDPPGFSEGYATCMSLLRQQWQLI